MKLIAAFAALFAVVDAVELTGDNYDGLVAGKTVFLKFYAPWCGHCKKIAPDWEKLEKEWDGHAVGFVGSVDCAGDGKSVCDSNGIQGFPTLKWGDPSALEDYQGGRTFSDMNTWAKENLKPVCSVSNIALCDDEKKALIAKYQAMDSAALKAEVDTAEGAIAKAEKDFQEEVGKLQKAYEGLNTAKEADIAKVKSSGLSMMKSVKKSRDAAPAEGSDEL